MIEIIDYTNHINAGIFDRYLEWLMNILKFTGMSFGSIFLICFIIYLVINFVIIMLVELIPFLKGIVIILQYILFPGSMMKMVWRVFAAKKLNIPTEMVHNFGFGWTRTGIKVNRSFKNLRESILYFYSPIMNVLVIIGWVIPGVLLFEWLDTLIDGTVFYWIWLYVLFSLVIFGLPSIHDLFNAFLITIVKTPEFYIFIVFYVVIAPTTLLLWGYGITIIFSLAYAILMFYEVSKISRKEEARLAKSYDKVLKKTERVYILTDSVSNEDY